MMALADWIDALEDLPRDAVERAIRHRIRSGDRARPLPGEIRLRAKALIEQAEPRAEVVPFPEREPSAAELERRKKFAATMAEAFSGLVKQIPTSEAD